MTFILIFIFFGAVSVKEGSADLGEILGQTLGALLKPVIDLDPDIGLDISELVDHYSYKFEAHQVITEDGYILTLHRIPYREPGSIRKLEYLNETVTRPVVLLVHGLFCSSGHWLFQGPNASLALQLADLGYDVWLSNSRGNSYSDKHVQLKKDDPAFWHFSIHEIGYYDMASTIDYILNETKVDRITYVGHSQGTTEATILTSSRPAYNEKLNLMVFLSPVIYINHLRSPAVKFLELSNDFIKLALNFFGLHAIEHGRYVHVICNPDNPVLQRLCLTVMQLFVGFDLGQIDKSKLKAFYSFTPSGASYMDIEHLLQQISSDEFRQYDYGDYRKNHKQYGSSKPPAYDLEQITAPVAIYYSKNDFFVGVEDAERFISTLKTRIVDQYLIEYDKFNHLDFIMAKDVKRLLYDRVIEVIKKYNPWPGN